MEIIEEPFTNELKKQIYDGFTQHSISMIGHDEKNPAVCFVVRENGKFLGTITFELFWGALHIKYIYVEEGNRGRQLGTKLLNKAEEYGRTHNCAFSFLETMSFQALDFYLKNGYDLEFTRSGFSHGSSFHYLRKELTL
ncbi:GNAT family N-acetyltransferase [archaeon]|nr:MAG: GNAT family N-acetyltransferase [archaeon]